MDKQHIRNELKKWFPEDFVIDQIMGHIEEHEKYNQPINKKERKKITDDVEKLARQLTKALGRLKRFHRSAYDRLEDNAYFYSGLKEMGDLEGIDPHDYLCSIETGAYFINQSNRESPQANLIKFHKGERCYYRTLNHIKYYRLFTELEILWLAQKHHVSDYDDGEFMKFLSLCSRGRIEYAASTRTAYKRLFAKADHWRQTKS